MQIVSVAAPSVYCTYTPLHQRTNRTDSELLAIKPTELNSY